jgi:DNA polymerase IV (DinB-like DNA polymerase)
MADEGGRIVVHVDMDAFYAAVEERAHPEWRGRPVVVGADPKEGRGRGVVTTANYAARTFGIRSAMPIAQAYRRCPQAIYVRPNFPLYEQVSEAIMGLLRTYADRFERVGVDEAFLDVSQRARTFDAAAELGATIQQEVEARFALTCSLGVGPNKLVAKVASDHRKPKGLTVVLPEMVEPFLAPKPVRALPGIGPKTEAVLAQRGIKTVADLQAQGREDLETAFGRFGAYLYDAARGVDDEEVEEGEGPPESVSTERTFPEDTRDYERIGAQLQVLATQLHEELVREGLAYRTVTLKVRFEDFDTKTRSRSLRVHTQDLEPVVALAADMLTAFAEDERKVRLVGVKLSHLQYAVAVQASLRRWA